jgi:hypothetical protein
LFRELLTNIEYNTILVVTNRYTKYRKFILYKEGSTVQEFVYTFLKYIVANYRIPEEFITDRNKIWISKFWQSFIVQLGVNYKLSTVYYLQTDRQTEKLNQALEVFLRYYINYNQDNWVQLLLIVQFVYNSTTSGPITVLLFFTNCRYNPTVYKQPCTDKIKAQDAIVYTDKLKDLYTQLELDLEFCRQRTAEYTNKKRS